MEIRSLLVVGALAEETACFGQLEPAACAVGAIVRLGILGVGKVAAAAATERLLAETRPDAAVLVGVAGGLKPEHGLGQVGVVQAAIDAEFDVRAWQPRLRRGEHPFTGERVFPAHPELTRRALAAAPSGKAFFAYAASGSVFLDHSAKRAFVRDVAPDLAHEWPGGGMRTPDLIDMETSAFLQIASAHGVPALALRAVSDPLEGDAAADFAAFLAGASATYVDMVRALLTPAPNANG